MGLLPSDGILIVTRQEVVVLNEFGLVSSRLATISDTNNKIENNQANLILFTGEETSRFLWCCEGGRKERGRAGFD
jgi:peptidase E